MTVYLFPGQGSQMRGMGAELFDTFPELTERADDILGYSVKSLCLEDPHQRLSDTRYAQPAIFVVNALSYQKKVEESKKIPTAVAGHSLGEYNALHAAGAIEFGDALTLVTKRGELMSHAGSGAMAAILGIDADAVRGCLENNDLLAVDIANYNAPLQTVISGLTDDILRAQEVFEKMGGVFVPLNTSGAFHSRYMAPAQVAFQKFLREYEFATPSIPVVSNVYAEPYQRTMIADTLVEQITHPVQWFQSMYYLLENGEQEFEEVGNGNVLTNLLAKTLDYYKASTVLPLSQGDSSPVELVEDQSGAAHGNNDQPLPGEADRKSVQVKVERWNERYAVGTRVRVKGYDDELETRSQAVVLFGHRAAIYVKDYKGYFVLDEVTAVISTVDGVFGEGADDSHKVV